MGTVTTTSPARSTAKYARRNETPKKSWGAIIGSTLAVIVLLSGSVWAWKHYRHLARVKKAEQLLAAAAQSRGNQPANSAQPNSGQRRFGLDDDTRKAIEALGLTEAERQELRDARQEEYRRRAQEEMDRYLVMSQKERWAYVQKKAAEMAKQFDRDATAAAKNGALAGNTPGGSRGNGANAGNGSQRPVNGGPGGPRTPDQRLQAQKRRLDNTTPQQRAERTIYISDLTKAINSQNNIRSGQGLPPLPLPRTRSG